MRNVLRIAEHELQRVTTRWQREGNFGLPRAEMPDLIGRRQRLVVWRQRVDIDQQVMVACVRGRRAGPL